MTHDSAYPEQPLSQRNRIGPATACRFLFNDDMFPLCLLDVASRIWDEKVMHLFQKKKKNRVWIKCLSSWTNQNRRAALFFNPNARKMAPRVVLVPPALRPTVGSMAADHARLQLLETVAAPGASKALRGQL